MPEFDIFLARHGESGLQAIIERLERNEGIRPYTHQSLEKRWEVVMQKTHEHQRAA